MGSVSIGCGSWRGPRGDTRVDVSRPRGWESFWRRTGQDPGGSPRSPLGPGGRRGQSPRSGESGRWEPSVRVIQVIFDLDDDHVRVALELASEPLLRVPVAPFAGIKPERLYVPLEQIRASRDLKNGPRQMLRANEPHRLDHPKGAERLRFGAGRAPRRSWQLDGCRRRRQERDQPLMCREVSSRTVENHGVAWILEDHVHVVALVPLGVQGRSIPDSLAAAVALQPVSRPTSEVGHGEDNNLGTLDEVADREWKARQQEPPDTDGLTDPRPERPGHRALADRLQSAAHLVGQVGPEPGHLLLVPITRRVEVGRRSRMKANPHALPTTPAVGEPSLDRLPALGCD